MNQPSKGLVHDLTGMRVIKSIHASGGTTLVFSNGTELTLKQFTVYEQIGEPKVKQSWTIQEDQ